MVPLDIRVSLSTYTCPGSPNINFHSTATVDEWRGFAAERNGSAASIREQ
jgi:hypothetical protein